METPGCPRKIKKMGSQAGMFLHGRMKSEGGGGGPGFSGGLQERGLGAVSVKTVNTVPDQCLGSNNVMGAKNRELLHGVNTEPRVSRGKGTGAHGCD